MTKEIVRPWQDSKVKITVQKCMDPSIIFDDDVPICPDTGEKYTVCPVFEEGQEFIVRLRDSTPEGFCWAAWKDLYRDLSVLVFGDFYPFVEKGTMFTCCRDGFRPVSFKLERL
jgi:uncharacterized repeat protein (TIGR04076 family)